MSRVKLSRLILVGLAAAAFAGGCASTHGPPKTLWRWDDPPHLSPRHRPLTDPSYEAVPPAAGEVQRPVSPPLEFPQTVPVPDGPPAAADPAEGPRIVPPLEISPARIELEIHAPRQVQTGSGILYRITVANLGDEPSEDLVIEARLDDGLVFPGREDKRVTQAIGRLAPGEQREIALTLVGERSGLQCCEFLVTARGLEVEWKSICVDVTPRRLHVTIVGPPRRTIGSRAEFNVKLANVADRPLRGIELALDYDPELAPRESSAGVRHEPGRLHWSLGDLEPGEGVQVQVEFECEAAGEACLLAAVRGDNVPADEAEACLSIAPRTGALDVHVSDRDDPIRTGDETEYVVTVHNRAPREAREVRVVADVPVGFEFVSAAVERPEAPLELAHRLEGEQVLFDPVPAVPPGAEVTFRIRVRGLESGDAAFRAAVTHADDAEPVEAIEPTTVNP